MRLRPLLPLLRRWLPPRPTSISSFSTTSLSTSPSPSSLLHDVTPLQFCAPRPLSRSCSTLAPSAPPQPVLLGVTQLTQRRMTQVEWSATEHDVYPWLWLRDNCQCPQCFHPSSLCRTFYIHDMQLDIEPLETECCGDTLRVSWSDGHTTQHTAAWLRQRAFTAEARLPRQRTHRIPRQPWPDTLLTMPYNAVMTTDQGLLQWLTLVETYGLVVLLGAPLEEGAVVALADRVAFRRQTHYGKQFSVIAKPDPSNVAYSSNYLALHLDLPYYQYKPGVQFIHCITQYEGEGGDSQVVDGVGAAERLRSAHPHLFHLLASTPVDWADLAVEDGNQHHKALKIPVICLGHDGSIERINFSQPQRDSFFSECPLEQVEDWYTALRTFHDILYDQCRTFKMENGMIQTIDNLRVLHGRTAYPSGGDVTRVLEGCYVDWDEMRCRRRVLEGC